MVAAAAVRYTGPMDKSTPTLALATLLLAAGGAWGQDSAQQPLPRPSATRYATSCVFLDATMVEGFVINLGTTLIKLSGPVSFSFTVTNSMGRPTIQTQSSMLVPPGTTVSVARAKLAGATLPGDICRLDIQGALRP